MLKNQRFLYLATQVLFCFLIISYRASAQVVKRIELPLQNANAAFQTMPLGDKGVLLISKPDKGTYNVQKFDTNLDRVWSIDGPVEYPIWIMSLPATTGNPFSFYSVNTAAHFTRSSRLILALVSWKLSQSIRLTGLK